MKLLERNLNEPIWDQLGVLRPKFDRETISKKTQESPSWLHFGGGNIFRVYIARIIQELIEMNQFDKGILVGESFDEQIIHDIYENNDQLFISVLMNEKGEKELKIVGSIIQSFTVTENLKDLLEIVQSKSLQIISFTITEKGYSIFSSKGEYLDSVKEDLENGPDKVKHAMTILSALLVHRYNLGANPIAILSLDNCSQNGDKIFYAIQIIAKEWIKRGFVDSGFMAYICSKNVSFPISMIDKITPRPDPKIAMKLKRHGIEGMDPLVTKKGSYVAAFVNAEKKEYLVIEDDFPNGRPLLEKVGIIFSDRKGVNLVEKMKVTTCLNPLHTALAVTGCLLGYTTIHEAVADPVLNQLVNQIGYKEGLPVVVKQDILDPNDFINDVIHHRLTNPAIPDSPQRIATDTSQKISIRFGHTIQSYLEKGDSSVEDLIGIPLALAAWLRYLLGIDDNLEEMEISSDPLKKELQEELSGINIGDQSVDLSKILKQEKIFGVDLEEAKLDQKITKYFVEMIQGKFAVRKTLEKNLL